MLNPSEQRIDYGDKLRPPPGYELTHAVATTFSLDLETLLCLPVAMCFDNTLEGEWQGEQMALLEAIGQMEGKLKVFFQQGNIKTPGKFRKLFALLEPSLVPVAPDGPFSSFHPKVWLMRFSSKDKVVRYRLLVLTRNLTFDRSWDIAAAIEGTLGPEKVSVDRGLLDFLKCLLPYSADFGKWMGRFEDELLRVLWDVPPGFSSVRMLPGHSQKKPMDFGNGTDSLLVMSPFLHPDALDMLGKDIAKRHLWLLSRAEELDRIGELRLKGWQCYALNERIVSGEEAIEEAAPKDQSLHAKILIAGNGSTFHWHLGSANATVAALGSIEAYPRNTEFMLRMTTSKPHCSISSVLDQLVGTEKKPKDIFRPHVFSPSPDGTGPLTDQVRRTLVYALLKAKWEVIATPDSCGNYDCNVSFMADSKCPIKIPNGLLVEVSQLALGDSFRSIHEPLLWKHMSLTQLSAFLPVRVSQIDSGDELLSLVMRADLIIEGGADRSAGIVRELVDSREKFLSYVRMLLEVGGNKPDWFDVDLSQATISEASPPAAVLEGPVLEMLLRSSARNPEHLKRIQHLLTRLEKTSAPIPEEFMDLWQRFSGYG